ncbi:hypothetical protein [Roseiconus lacunae]|uniref:hypothetical protein n=1 Tax=Roseiconus lacunae TaxID=2605694 RepID=UPI001E605CA7|nr:hypothetical protein [Roseiconus lacunae]MCD0460096.1 hypothetical protein [Roseiconus lacunae]
MNHPEMSPKVWSLAISLWGCAVVGVWTWSTQHEFSVNAKSVNVVPSRWPAASEVVKSDDRATLILFLHPRCPCTRATIVELEKTLTGRALDASQLPKCFVVASLPTDADQRWLDSQTVRRAANLPNAEVVWDYDGHISSSFGAITSGTVMLYRIDGHLQFSGGVTISRGHEGSSLGADRLHALLHHDDHGSMESTPVFGCRLCLDSSS